MKACIALAGLCLVVFGLSKGFALEAAPLKAPSAPFIPVVVFGADQRATTEDFALSHHIEVNALRQQYAATGIVRCGGAHGSGQLTVADDVVTTAAHVLFDRDGKLRGDQEHCHFLVEADGKEISTQIDVQSAIVGSSNPYNEDAVHDWAVVKLVHPLHDVAPYALAKPKGEEPVRLVARGAVDWAGARGMSLQDCAMHADLANGSEGTREYAFDCSSNVGASGSGLFDADGTGLLAVFVGFRSVAPDRPLPFSSTHYNFAVTIEGAFRRAVEREATLNTAAQ